MASFLIQDAADKVFYSKELRKWVSRNQIFQATIFHSRDEAKTALAKIKEDYGDTLGRPRVVRAERYLVVSVTPDSLLMGGDG